MNSFNVIRWIVWKDFVTELRSRETISSMVFFALIVILIFSFSFSMDQQAAREVIAGIMWVAFAFTGIIGLGKSFSTELQNDCLEALQMGAGGQGGDLPRQGRGEFRVHVRGGNPFISDVCDPVQFGGR